MLKSELIRTLFELRYDMDLIGEHCDPERELQNLSDEELQALIAEYSECRNA